MVRLASLVFLSTLGATAAQAQAPDVPACGVELRIHTTSPVVQPDGGAVYFHRLLVAELVNTSGETVTLVQPGDGSGAGWRTPILRWNLTAEEGYTPPQQMRCGNINRLRAGEVFSLRPGASRRLTDWIPPIFGVAPGSYRLRLSYVNDPALQWQGLELGPHDPEEMQRVRESTSCRVESNEISLTILPAAQ